MGGINSGRRRSVNRGAVEQHPCIDLSILRRAGLLRAGECTYTTLTWANQAPQALSARIFIDLSDPVDASMRIVGLEADGATGQRVAFECVPCPYGGMRNYFLCPLNGTRCELLFLVDGVFACRKAHRLTYACQSEDNLSRARRKVSKLHRQIEGDSLYARPRGRKRRRAVLRVRVAEREARMLYLDRLRALVGDVP